MSHVKITTFPPSGPHTVLGHGPGGSCLILKDESESRISTTTRTADHDLRMPLATNERWIGQMDLDIGIGDAVADIRIHLAVPSGATGRWAVLGLSGVEDFRFRARNTFGSGTNIIVGVLTNADTGLQISFVVQNGNTVGDLILFWAQNVSSPTASVIRANSFIVANRL